MCQFIRARRRVITKPLSDLFTYDWHDGPYASYTTEVTESDVAVLPSFGFPMLLQELLAKSYDIRLFYLDRVFYGMAIFSQSRNQTSVDFRRYTYERPVRTVPY